MHGTSNGLMILGSKIQVSLNWEHGVNRQVPFPEEDARQNGVPIQVLPKAGRKFDKLTGLALIFMSSRSFQALFGKTFVFRNLFISSARISLKSSTTTAR